LVVTGISEPCGEPYISPTTLFDDLINLQEAPSTISPPKTQPELNSANYPNLPCFNLQMGCSGEAFIFKGNALLLELIVIN
jgi:hypothetical protein